MYCKPIFPIFLMISIALILAGCGVFEARGSGGVYAVEIPGPNGVRCFAILNDNGETVGGNCK